METRVAVMSIIVEDNNSVERINAILHEYGEYIIGRASHHHKAHYNIDFRFCQAVSF